jgi:hypothetical protein
MVDVLAYADDLLLITKSKLDLQIMLQKIKNLGNELEIKFNASKSMKMVFNKYHHRTAKEQKYDEWNGDNYYKQAVQLKEWNRLNILDNS